MKRMILTTPNHQWQLPYFICQDDLHQQLQELITNRFDPYALVRIESAPGNGSSFLLHALANQLKLKGEHIAFLHFEKDDDFSELNEYLFSKLAAVKFVFIDNLHHVLADSKNWDRLRELLQPIDRNKAKLIYSTESQETQEDNQKLETIFGTPAFCIDLAPLQATKRSDWAKILLKQDNIAFIPMEIFEEKNSNAEFLESLTPYLEQVETASGRNTSQMREQEMILQELELRYTKASLALQEIRPIKSKIIRNQEYEKAADIRQTEKKYMFEIAQIRNELDELSIEPKPSKHAMDVYHQYLRLKTILEAYECSFIDMVQTIRNQIEVLNARKLELNVREHAAERKELFENLVSWMHVLSHYSAK